MLDQQEKQKWYFKSSVIILAFLFAGPLALPLVWFRPRLNKGWKFFISIAVVILTWYSIIALSNSIRALSGHYQELLKSL